MCFWHFQVDKPLRLIANRESVAAAALPACSNNWGAFSKHPGHELILSKARTLLHKFVPTSCPARAKDVFKNTPLLFFKVENLERIWTNVIDRAFNRFRNHIIQSTVRAWNNIQRGAIELPIPAIMKRPCTFFFKYEQTIDIDLQLDMTIRYYYFEHFYWLLHASAYYYNEHLLIQNESLLVVSTSLSL